MSEDVLAARDKMLSPCQALQSTDKEPFTADKGLRPVKIPYRFCQIGIHLPRFYSALCFSFPDPVSPADNNRNFSPDTPCPAKLPQSPAPPALLRTPWNGIIPRRDAIATVPWCPSTSLVALPSLRCVELKASGLASTSARTIVVCPRWRRHFTSRSSLPAGI